MTYHPLASQLVPSRRLPGITIPVAASVVEAIVAGADIPLQVRAGKAEVPRRSERDNLSRFEIVLHASWDNLY